jgi:predicted RNA binding protein YcfA (HicA-like mRNA interferase family)
MCGQFDKPNVWFEDRTVTWADLVRLLRQHGFEELRTGKGSHRQFWNPTSQRIVTIAVHTKKEVGTGLLNRILKDAGIKESKH